MSLNLKLYLKRKCWSKREVYYDIHKQLIECTVLLEQYQLSSLFSPLLIVSLDQDCEVHTFKTLMIKITFCPIFGSNCGHSKTFLKIFIIDKNNLKFLQRFSPSTCTYSLYINYIRVYSYLYVHHNYEYLGVLRQYDSRFSYQHCNICTVCLENLLFRRDLLLHQPNYIYIYIYIYLCSGAAPGFWLGGTSLKISYTNSS